MRELQYRSEPLFDNLDPSAVDSDDILRKDGKIVAVIHAEYVVKKVVYGNSKLTIVLRKVWSNDNGRPVGSHLTLQFEGARAVSSPVNEEEGELGKVTELRDLRVFTPKSEAVAQGYKKGVELDTDQGLWEISFKKARAIFDPPL